MLEAWGKFDGILRSGTRNGAAIREYWNRTAKYRICIGTHLLGHNSYPQLLFKIRVILGCRHLRPNSQICR